jgi:hypothetical protein
MASPGLTGVGVGMDEALVSVMLTVLSLKTLNTKSVALKVWVTPSTVRVPRAVTRFWVMSPATNVDPAVVLALNVMVIC